jgi:hypothetical protein
MAVVHVRDEQARGVGSEIHDADPHAGEASGSAS